MIPKNVESFSGHSSPVLSRELGAAHRGSRTFFSTFGDRRRDLVISQRSRDQNGDHAVEAQDFPQIKGSVITWFEEQLKDFFSRGINSLQQNWAMCIELLGDYIEN